MAIGVIFTLINRNMIWPWLIITKPLSWPHQSQLLRIERKCIPDKKQIDLAFKDHDKAVELDPKYSFAYQARGEDYYRKPRQLA